MNIVKNKKMSDQNKERKPVSAYMQLSGILNALKTEEITLNDAMNKIQDIVDGYVTNDDDDSDVTVDSPNNDEPNNDDNAANPADEKGGDDKGNNQPE